ncbi:glycosyltransferase [Pseudomonadales bacterium]|nr:glycosyltransferase [Pseudomonadales bacterium]
MPFDDSLVDMKAGKVSIIMPSYNVSRFISESIESVMAQTYQNWELIICDDGSTDRTLEIALSYKNRDKRIQVLRNRNSKGAPGARNTSLEHSTGRYIAFLDSDDLWLPNKLSLQLEFMTRERISFAFSYHDVIDENGGYVASYKAPKRVDASLMRFSNFIPCLTVVYDTKTLGKVEQPNIQKRNDFALWLKILNSGYIEFAYCLPVVTAKYRANSYGLSSEKAVTLHYYKKCLREFGKVSLVGAEVFLVLYIALGGVKAKFSVFYNRLVVWF